MIEYIVFYVMSRPTFVATSQGCWGIFCDCGAVYKSSHHILIYLLTYLGKVTHIGTTAIEQGNFYLEQH